MSKGWQLDERQLKLRLHADELVARRMSIYAGEQPNTMETLPPLTLDWRRMYKDRCELDNRWRTSEPKTFSFDGHDDSIYCVDFDNDKIITGSRDRTIKIWDMRTGKLRATLRGHAGSVLCLKFDKKPSGDSADSEFESGFMVSGSSDRTVLVWDLNDLRKSGKTEGGPELVKRVLRGHTGGVLDIRIDENWIVSWCENYYIIYRVY